MYKNFPQNKCLIKFKLLSKTFENQTHRDKRVKNIKNLKQILILFVYVTVSVNYFWVRCTNLNIMLKQPHVKF